MKKVLTIAAAVFLVGGASSAMAQDDDRVDVTPSNISVRIGVGLPLDNNLSNFGSTLLALGAEYNLASPLIKGTDTYFSLDYFTNGLKFENGIIPFCINERIPLNHGLVGHRTYGFVGVGGAVIDLGTSGTVLAARGGFGADLGEAIFFEAAATVTDKTSGVTGDNVAFYVGYRF